METQPIAVIIPCYNAADTLHEAVTSALNQAAVSSIWIVDDVSSDNSVTVAQTLAARYPDKIKLLNMTHNSGAALARNWAALHVSESLIAFLDADDIYSSNALDVAAFSFKFIAELAAVRLALHPLGWADKYTAHPDFPRAWRGVEMTGAGNLIIRRSVFLAAGGFPTDELFKRHGGEDAALGLALHASVMVGTLFDQTGVHYRHKNGSHGERLLNTYLHDQAPEGITTLDINQANAVTERIKTTLTNLRPILAKEHHQAVPLMVEMG